MEAAPIALCTSIFVNMYITRRRCLKLANEVFALGTAGLFRRSKAAQALAYLKDAAADKGIIYGALADMNLDTAPAAYRDLFRQQSALCAVDIWAPAVSSGPGAFNFATSENANIIAAGAHGLPITGAHLLWYYHMPDWFVHVSGRRLGARQDDRCARPDVQAGNRRHARLAGLGDCGPAGR
jgi:GH35 family endo-1,4-beta-xylanase